MQEIARIVARNATRIDLPKWLQSEPQLLHKFNLLCIVSWTYFWYSPITELMWDIASTGGDEITQRGQDNLYKKLENLDILG